MKDAVNSKIIHAINAMDKQSISEERRKTLQPLINYIQDKLDRNEAVLLNFICTHNSRRSHLSQVWAQVMAAHFGLSNVFAYSGGSEATAMFPLIGETLQTHGFEIVRLSEGKNPVYVIKFGKNAHPVIGFSKTYNHPFNPTSDFAAIMTCSQADVACPFIPGAKQRFPITYEDPKSFDGTPRQAQIYRERSLQIATELFYVFSSISE